MGCCSSTAGDGTTPEHIPTAPRRQRRLQTGCADTPNATPQTSRGNPVRNQGVEQAALMLKSGSIKALDVAKTTVAPRLAPATVPAGGVMRRAVLDGGPAKEARRQRVMREQLDSVSAVAAWLDVATLAAASAPLGKPDGEVRPVQPDPAALDWYEGHHLSSDPGDDDSCSPDASTSLQLFGGDEMRETAGATKDDRGSRNSTLLSFVMFDP